MSEPRHDAPEVLDKPQVGDGRIGAAASAAVADGPVGRATLITFPPSLSCELSRFLLAYYGIPFDERRHTIYFSIISTMLHGGTSRFPLLCSGTYPPLDAVRKIIDYLDQPCPAERNLLLSGRDRDRVEADWERFGGTLERATAALAYFHLLPNREVMLRPLTEGTPWYEVLAVRWAFPVFASALRSGLGLSPERAQESLGQIREIVQAVDARLADGRRYLVGDRFSLSDMAFANAMSPVVLPPQYAGPLPSFAEMPPVLQSVVTEMQAHPAGQFALRIFRDHRGGATAATPQSG